jgi:hypothetical protein
MLFVTTTIVPSIRTKDVFYSTNTEQLSINTLRIKNLSILYIDNDILSIGKEYSDSAYNQVLTKSIDCRGKWIIVAGSRYDYALQDRIDYECNLIYRKLLNWGYLKNEIYYLSWKDQDADNDGINDVSAEATSANIESAIKNWAVPKVNQFEPLYIYCTDHGNTGGMALRGGTDRLTPSALNNWLNTLPTDVPINIVYCACNAGCFIDDISKTGRVILTSCTIDQHSGFDPSDTADFFSHCFWPFIFLGHTYGDAFNYATDLMDQLKPHGHETPLLDDDGNYVGHQAPIPSHNDGYLALTRRLIKLITGGEPFLPPEIVYTGVNPVQTEIWIPEEPIINLWIQIDPEISMKKVFAYMLPPNWEPPIDPDGGIIEMDLEHFNMTDTYPYDGLYTVNIPISVFLENANGSSLFKFIISCEDYNGNIYPPLVTGVRFTTDGKPLPDKTSPIIQIYSPIRNQVINEETTICGVAIDNECLKKIELHINDELIESIDISPMSCSKFEFKTDLTSIASDETNVTIKAYDASNNYGSYEMPVFVGSSIRLEHINGGFGVNIEVCNKNIWDISYVDWSITFNGIIVSNYIHTGTIDQIKANEYINIKSGFVLGIGPANIDIIVGDASRTVKCFLIGPFVLSLSD